MQTTPADRYRSDDLIAAATALLSAGGLAEPRARIVAETLVEGDLMGHTTHGLQLLAPYLDAIARGVIAKEGAPVVVSDRGSAVTWDGGFLPGPWLVREAMDEMFARVATHPVVTFVLRRSGHIGCLAAYPRLATERGLVLLLTCSDPSVASVAPHGAVEARITPNPIAAGWPTHGDPVILDVSASTTTNGMVARLNRSGGRLPGAWLVDREGRASDDPSVVSGSTPGAILPLGGLELGHKGFALGLLVETLTAALGGVGRADQVGQWGAAVFLQLIDPEAFGGRDGFLRETSFLADACRGAATAPDAPPARMPGARGLALRETQLREGVALHPGIMPALADWAGRLGVTLPAPLGG